MFDDLFKTIVPMCHEKEKRGGDAPTKITVDDIPRAAILDVSKP